MIILVIIKYSASLYCKLGSIQGFPRWLSAKESAHNVGDSGSIPVSGEGTG